MFEGHRTAYGAGPTYACPRYAAPGYTQAAFGVPAQGAMTGWTAREITFGKMRQMHEASAEPMNRDVDQHVADPAYRAAWDGWYQRAWLPFFDRYAGPHASIWTKLGASLESDEIARQAESFRLQLEHFYRTYPQQRTRDGQPVPPPTGAPPVLGGLPAERGVGGIALPWWGWALGIAAVGGAGWYLIERVRRTRNTARAADLGRALGRELAQRRR